jgi:hypothetical protein
MTLKKLVDSGVPLPLSDIQRTTFSVDGLGRLPRIVSGNGNYSLHSRPQPGKRFRLFMADSCRKGTPHSRGIPCRGNGNNG